MHGSRCDGSCGRPPRTPVLARRPSPRTHKHPRTLPHTHPHSSTRTPHSFACKLAGNVMSGAAAGACSLGIVYSLDYARTRLANDATDSHGKRQFTGLISVYKKVGMRGAPTASLRPVRLRKGVCGAAAPRVGGGLTHCGVEAARPRMLRCHGGGLLIKGRLRSPRPAAEVPIQCTCRHHPLERPGTAPSPRCPPSLFCSALPALPTLSISFFKDLATGPLVRNPARLALHLPAPYEKAGYPDPASPDHRPMQPMAWRGCTAGSTCPWSASL